MLTTLSFTHKCKISLDSPANSKALPRLSNSPLCSFKVKEFFCRREIETLIGCPRRISRSHRKNVFYSGPSQTAFIICNVSPPAETGQRNSRV